MPDEMLRPRLTVLSEPLRGAQFRLAHGASAIGSDSTVEVQIDHATVSPRHAVVELSGGGAWLADLGSTNGTWLNGRLVADQAPLRDGDRIRLGDVELSYYDPANSLTDPVGAPLTLVRRPTPLALPGSAQRERLDSAALPDATPVLADSTASPPARRWWRWWPRRR